VHEVRANMLWEYIPVHVCGCHASISGGPLYVCLRAWACLRHCSSRTRACAWRACAHACSHAHCTQQVIMHMCVSIFARANRHCECWERSCRTASFRSYFSSPTEWNSFCRSPTCPTTPTPSQSVSAPSPPSAA
jgi:hypothetical protein